MHYWWTKGLLGSPGDSSVDLTSSVTTSQCEVQFLVVIAMGKQLRDGQGSTTQEDLVGRTSAMIVPNFKRDARVRYKKTRSRTSANWVPKCKCCRGHFVAGTWHTAFSVLDWQLDTMDRGCYLSAAIAIILTVNLRSLGRKSSVLITNN